MHRGCFVWTPTPPLLGRRTPRRGPVRVCVCLSVLAGSSGPASRARCAAPHLFLWPVLVRSLFARPPPGSGSLFFLLFLCAWLSPAFLVFGPGLPALGVWPPPSPLFFSFLCPPFFFFFGAPAVSGVPCFLARSALGFGVFLSRPPPAFFFSAPLFFLALPLSLVFGVFRPGLPWALASSCLPLPPPFFFPLLFLAPFVPPPLACLFFFSLCALVVSWVPCFPAWGALGLGVFLSPPLLFFCFSSVLFFLVPWLFFCAPVVSGVPCVPARVALGLGALLSPPPPPLLFFPSCLFFAFFFSSSVICRWCGAGLVCVSPAVGCAGVCFGGAVPVVALCAVLSRPSGASWCCMVLPVVFGCLLLGLAVLRCVLVSCFGGAVPVWPPGSPPCDLVWCVLVLRCPVLCSVTLPCRVVVCCRALLFVCVVASACCLFPAAGRLLCVFWAPVLCVPCPLRPVRCCAALCWCPCVVLSAWSVLFLVLGAVGSWCRCVFLGVRWWLWLPGVVVFGGVCRPWCPCLAASPVAQRLPCGVLFPCAVSCGAVLPCGAVLWCPVVFFSFFLFLCLACGAGCLFPLKAFLKNP